MVRFVFSSGKLGSTIKIIPFSHMSLKLHRVCSYCSCSGSNHATDHQGSPGRLVSATPIIATAIVSASIIPTIAFKRFTNQQAAEQAAAHA